MVAEMPPRHDQAEQPNRVDPNVGCGQLQPLLCFVFTIHDIGTLPAMNYLIRVSFVVNRQFTFEPTASRVLVGPLVYSQNVRLADAFEAQAHQSGNFSISKYHATRQEQAREEAGWMMQRKDIHE